MAPGPNYFKFKALDLKYPAFRAHDMTMDELIIAPHDGWTRLILNRPAQRNALSTRLLARLADALERLAEDPACRVALLCGADGNFAAGADIGEIETKTSAAAAVDPRKELWARIRRFPKPLVAAVDGFCLGGGFELALMADCIVAGVTARFGLPETNLGIMPGAGGSQRLLALVGRARASRMVLTGEIIDAATAESWGIVGWRSSADAGTEADSLCAKLAVRAPLALQAAKRAIIAGDEAALDFVTERSNFEALFDSADKREGIAAFREKRKPEFRGQ